MASERSGKKVQLANLLFKGNYAVSGDIDAVKKVTSGRLLILMIHTSNLCPTAVPRNSSLLCDTTRLPPFHSRNPSPTCATPPIRSRSCSTPPNS